MEQCNVCGRGFETGAFCPDHPAEPPPHDATSAIGEGTRLFASNAVVFLALWFVPTVAGSAVSFLSAQAALGSRPVGDCVGAFRTVVFLFIGGLPSFLLAMVFAGGTAALVNQAIGGSRPRLSDAVKAMRSRLPDLFWSALILATIFLLTVTVFNLPGVVFCSLGIDAMAALLSILGAVATFLAVFVIFHWFMFTPFVAALERVKPHRSLVESKLFAARNRTAGFTILLLIVGFVIAVANALTTTALAEGFPVEDRLTAREVMSGVFLWIATPLLAVMMATLYVRMRTPVRLYESLRPQVVTTCPSCRAPISFTPSGDAVHIKCGACGREGILRPGRRT